MYRPTQHVDCQGCKVSPRKTCKCNTRHGDHRRLYSQNNIGHSLSRFHELACAKQAGCGPKCKYYRCAANDPCYTTPFYAPTRSIGRPMPSPSLLRNTCSRIAQIRGISKRVSLGLKYLQEAQELEGLKGDFAGMKLMATKSLASNTDQRSCYEEVKDSSAQVQTSPIPADIVAPVSRVRPPRPSPPQMMRYALLQQERLPMAPQHIGHVMVPPLASLHGIKVPPQHEPELSPFHCMETFTPVSLTSRRETPFSTSHPQLSDRQKWLPRELSPRLHTPPVVKMDPKAPLVVSYPGSRHSSHPPSRPPSHPPSRPPSHPPSQPPSHPPSYPPSQLPSHHPSHPPSHPPSRSSSEARTGPPIGPPTGPPMGPLIGPPIDPPTIMPTGPPIGQRSPFSSNCDSDLTTTAESTVSDSGTATCLCDMCGGLEKGLTMALYKNNNNPLYDLATPLETSESERGGRGVVTMGVGSGGGGGVLVTKARYWALEVTVLLVVGGLVTFGLLLMVESMFGTCLTRSCGCLGVWGKAQPQLVADGMTGKVVSNWVSCPLTPVR